MLSINLFYTYSFVIVFLSISVIRVLHGAMAEKHYESVCSKITIRYNTVVLFNTSVKKLRKQ